MPLEEIRKLRDALDHVIGHDLHNDIVVALHLLEGRVAPRVRACEGTAAAILTNNTYNLESTSTSLARPPNSAKLMSRVTHSTVGVCEE